MVTTYFCDYRKVVLNKTRISDVEKTVEEAQNSGFNYVKVENEGSITLFNLNHVLYFDGNDEIDS